MRSASQSGTSNQNYGVVTALVGGGAAIRLTERLFLRPQLRYQDRERFSILGGGGKLPSPLSMVVAFGYQF